MQIQDEIDEKNINEDEQSVSLRDHKRVTVGNDMCSNGGVCGYRGQKYSWCYTVKNWDYCCIGPCEVDVTGRFMSCDVGDRRTLCGNAGTTTISGNTCIASHPCGLHGTGNDFWCFKDYKFRWEYCCSPLSGCSNNRCTVNYSKGGSYRMQSCSPSIQK
ncbi:hypothetical protein CHS0354_015223 [Potamilus streckersoni]|uniref:Uncharacterized protein n=1 Tax=Potamilus streckersoni TaxID=2493646 RepID=A0AAE0VHU4_9BIVA|nr:hypothetical protein CHS0354_015223 [Potamilus streckersoni]